MTVEIKIGNLGQVLRDIPTQEHGVKDHLMKLVAVYRKIQKQEENHPNLYFLTDWLNAKTYTTHEYLII